MNDKELALELLKVYSEKQKSFEWWHIVDNYHKILESIRGYKSETTLGKMEELIDEYDNSISYCDFDRINLIDNFRKLVKNNKEN